MDEIKKLEEDKNFGEGYLEWFLPHMVRQKLDMIRERTK